MKRAAILARLMTTGAATALVVYTVASGPPRDAATWLLDACLLVVFGAWAALNIVWVILTLGERRETRR